MDGYRCDCPDDTCNKIYHMCTFSVLDLPLPCGILALHIVGGTNIFTNCLNQAYGIVQYCEIYCTYLITDFKHLLYMCNMYYYT